MRLQLPPAPPAFARCNAAGEGCRAEVNGTQAGVASRQEGYGSAGQFELRGNSLRLSAARKKLPHVKLETREGLLVGALGFGTAANPLRDGVRSNSALFESAVDGANPSPAANFRPVVK